MCVMLVQYYTSKFTQQQLKTYGNRVTSYHGWAKLLCHFDEVPNRVSSRPSFLDHRLPLVIRSLFPNA